MNFLLFAESLYIENIPIGLKTMGYQPIVIILIESIRYFYNNNPIYVVISQNLDEKGRWFGQYSNIYYVKNIRADFSLIEFMNKKKIKEICTLDCRYPLLSKFTIREFIKESNEGSFNMISSKHVLQNCIILRLQDFTNFENLKTYVLKDKKEALGINNPDDLLYMEHIYLEDKHIVFLHQCYELWKKSMLLEERIAHLEKIVLLD